MAEVSNIQPVGHKMSDKSSYPTHQMNFKPLTRITLNYRFVVEELVSVTPPGGKTEQYLHYPDVKQRFCDFQAE